VVCVENSITNKPPKLNIVCELKTVPPGTTGSNAIETVYQLEKQQGTWNKDLIKWWAKGEVDEFFENRLNFMKRVFNMAFTEWDIEIPLVFVQAESEEDADIIIEWGTRANDPYYSGSNGDFVLAYAGYPSGGLKGYMKIFTHWDWDVKGDYNTVTMIIHELGHLIGRPHSERRIWQDIMDPIINANVTELSDHDIAGATAEYGTREYSQDTHHDRLEKANRRSKERLRLQDLQPISGNS